MKSNDILEHFSAFILKYSQDEKNKLWENKSSLFKDFWYKTILSESVDEINDQEIDAIVRILDVHGKGNTKDSEAVATVMIPQGAWRRMFNEIHKDNKLSKVLTRIFEDSVNEKRGTNINTLYKINENRKNSLTGQSGNAVNTLLSAYNPFENLSIVSLNDRAKLIKYCNFEYANEIDNMSSGDKIVKTNKSIIEGFKKIGVNGTARTISVFCYEPNFKRFWKTDISTFTNGADKDDSTSVIEKYDTNEFLFYMESQLEDFLIENWDKTQLGNDYELIEENGELVSQQYKTSIGKIDILAQEKKTGRYVIIELKKNQTSDDTIGQLARYMGWIEESKSNGKLTKGIIIAGRYDDRLYYAAKKIPDVQMYLYKVDFKLNDFRK